MRAWVQTVAISVVPKFNFGRIRASVMKD